VKIEQELLTLPIFPALALESSTIRNCVLSEGLSANKLV
jgi:hypothetical protein